LRRGLVRLWFSREPFSHLVVLPAQIQWGHSTRPIAGFSTQFLQWDLGAVSAATPNEAINLFREEHFDLALVDYEMPGMNGVELARRLKELGLISGTRMILSSSSGTSQREMLGDRENNPFDAFLTKPTKSDHLKEVVARLVGGAPPTSARRPSLAIETTLAARRPLRILLAEDNVIIRR
jgi:CheY-like chemotaxis protein